MKLVFVPRPIPYRAGVSQTSKREQPTAPLTADAEPTPADPLGVRGGGA